MEDLAPLRERLVGRKEHGLSSQIPPVDDMVEHIRSVLPEGQVANFVDDENRGSHISFNGLLHPTFFGSNGELLDQLGGGDEERVEAVEDGLVCDGDRQMGLSPPRLSLEDEGASRRYELGPQEAPEHDLP